MDRALHETERDHETESGPSGRDVPVVALGDEHDKGVESLCVGEAA
jgi:hypothetical protein